MCVNNLSKVALNSAAAGIEPAISMSQRIVDVEFLFISGQSINQSINHNFK